MSRLWQSERADGSWEWLDVGLEPFEAIDSGYQGAAFAALAVGMTPMLSDGTVARAGIARLRNYLRSQYPCQNVYNQVWGLLASTFLNGVLTDAVRVETLEQRRSAVAGRWKGGGWRWSRSTPPFQSPGPRPSPW
jgi:hypothetical protein